MKAPVPASNLEKTPTASTWARGLRVFAIAGGTFLSLLVSEVAMRSVEQRGLLLLGFLLPALMLLVVRKRVTLWIGVLGYATGILLTAIVDTWGGVDEAIDGYYEWLCHRGARRACGTIMTISLHHSSHDYHPSRDILRRSCELGMISGCWRELEKNKENREAPCRTLEMICKKGRGDPNKPWTSSACIEYESACWCRPDQAEFAATVADIRCDEEPRAEQFHPGSENSSLPSICLTLRGELLRTPTGTTFSIATHGLQTYQDTRGVEPVFLFAEQGEERAASYARQLEKCEGQTVIVRGYRSPSSPNEIIPVQIFR